MVPAPFALLETVATPGLRLVTMTLIGASGADPRTTFTGVCILTPVVALPMLVPSGATTVAVTCVYCGCDGVLKLVGCVPSVTVVEPAPTGTKVVLSEVSPAFKLTGLVEMVPTVPSPLVTVRAYGYGPAPGLSWP